MKRPKQLHRRADRMSPEEVARFLDDFAKTTSGVDAKTRLISLRVPENVLDSFKMKAKLKGLKYQSEIVRLMRNWAMGSSRH